MNISALKNVPLLAALSDQELRSMSEAMVKRTFPKDAIILLAEEEGDTLFVITRGRVKVTAMSEDGREIILSILKAGDFFGDMALLDGKPRSATVIATEETEALLLRRGDFIHQLERSPRMALAMLAELSTRLRRADRQIESLALLNVYGRIAGILLQLAEEQGIRTKEGVAIPERPIHQELANMAGTTRETVSRVLGDLERRGYLAIEGRRITILGEERLKEDFFQLGS